MLWLVDTNVISEPFVKAPNRDVLDWLERHDAEYLVSAVTMEELRFGAERMPEGRRRERIIAAIDRIEADYRDRIAVFGAPEAAESGRLRAAAVACGNNVYIADVMIAATARLLGATVVTRNVRDFEPLGVPVFNPYGDAASMRD